MTRLYFGCGLDYRKGYINADLAESPGPKDITVFRGCLIPLNDDSVDEILSIHTFEHIPLDAMRTVFNELHRVAKPGCRVTFIVPHYSSPGAHVPWHTTFWSVKTWRYITDGRVDTTGESELSFPCDDVRIRLRFWGRGGNHGKRHIKFALYHTGLDWIWNLAPTIAERFQPFGFDEVVMTGRVAK